MRLPGAQDQAPHLLRRPRVRPPGKPPTEAKTAVGLEHGKAGAGKGVSAKGNSMCDGPEGSEYSASRWETFRLVAGQSPGSWRLETQPGWAWRGQ